MSVIATEGKAITVQRTTGYYVTTADGLYADADGRTWFSKAVAAAICRKLGGWYEQGNRTTVKDVVTGYESA